MSEKPHPHSHDGLEQRFGPRYRCSVLVAVDGPASSARSFGVQFDLEDLLGGWVDLRSPAPALPMRPV